MSSWYAPWLNGPGMQHVICTYPGWEAWFSGLEFRCFDRTFNEPLQFLWRGTHKVGPKDLVADKLFDLTLVSDAVRQVLLSELRGFEFHPAVIWWGEERLDYWVVRSKHLFKSYCYRKVVPDSEGYVTMSDPKVVGLDADVSDIWFGPGYKDDPYNVEMLVSERFASLAKRMKWKHVSFEALEDQSFTVVETDTDRFMCEGR